MSGNKPYHCRIGPLECCFSLIELALRKQTGLNAYLLDSMFVGFLSILPLRLIKYFQVSHHSLS